VVYVVVNLHVGSKEVGTILIAVLLGSGSLASAQSADYGGYRPSYQGYGVNTPAGRGGVVCRVTSLIDSPWQPGTLRHCVETSAGPRFVIFEISGTITLSYGPVFVRNPFVTIAGQTAPSPGIVIRGPGLIIDTHDVVVQHLRARVGNLRDEPTGLWLRDDADRVVIDHVSVSWAVWTSVPIGANRPGHPTGEVTIVDSIIAETLACSGVNSLVPCDPARYPGTGWSNSRGIGIGDAWGHEQPKVTLLRSISAHNNDRHPEISGGSRTVLVNNLIYNPSQTPLSSFYYHDANKAGPLFSVVQGNVLIPGPTTPGHNGYVPREYAQDGEVKLVRIHPSIDPSSRIYLAGNYYEKHCPNGECLASSTAQWMLAKDFPFDWYGISVRATTPPLQLTNLPLSSTLPYTAVEEYVLANAGARPTDRDATDSRLISEIASRSGSVPNRTSEKAGPGTAEDGFPILASNRRTLAVPNQPNDVVDAVGRTRIESWLEEFARELEPGGAVSSQKPSAPSGIRVQSTN
jgi:hypothetical protein